MIGYAATDVRRAEALGDNLPGLAHSFAAGGSLRITG